MPTMSYEDYFATLLPEKETRELLDRASKGDMQARNKVVEHNVAFVIFKVKRNPKRRKSHMDFDDFVSVGVLGLIRAADKWDGDRCTKFTTYANHWIKHETNEANHLGQLFRIPKSTMEKAIRSRSGSGEKCNPETLQAIERFQDISISPIFHEKTHPVSFMPSIEKREEIDSLYQIVDRNFPEVYGRVFRLKMIGHTAKEISEKVSLNISTVRKYLNKILPVVVSEMRAKFRDNCEGECKAICI